MHLMLNYLKHSISNPNGPGPNPLFFTPQEKSP